MTQNQINGNRIFLLISIIITCNVLISCSSLRLSPINNYITGSRYFNDSLSISASLFGDIDYINLSKNEFKEKKLKIKDVTYKDLLIYGKSSYPAYDVFLFSKKKEPHQ